MISWMQKHKKYLVVTVWISTIAFVGAGFVGWGAYKYGGASHDSIAKVGDIEVTNKDLQNSYTKIFNYFNQMYGGTLTREKAKELRLENIALEQLFNQTLYLNYAKELGLDVSEREVLQEIANIPSFWVNGVFSESKYEAILRSMQMTNYDFKKNIKKSLIIDKLFKALKLPVTNLELETIFATQFMQDRLKIKLFDDKNITISISENMIKDFWQKNKDKYKSQRKYEVDIVKVDAKDINVSEEELRNFYKEKKFMFKDLKGKILPYEQAKERVKYTLQMKRAKKEILKKYIKLKNKEIKPQEHLILSKFNTKIPMQQIVNAKIGDFIRSIKTVDGYVSVKLVNIIEPKVLPFEKAKEYAKSELLKKLKKDKLIQLAKMELNKNDGEDIGFVSRSDVDKIKKLNTLEAKQFLNYIFSQQDKKGFYLLNNKVIVYNIIEQKIMDKKLFEAKKEDIKKITASLKDRYLKNSLLKELSKKYKIVKYYKTKG